MDRRGRQGVQLFHTNKEFPSQVAEAVLVFHPATLEVDVAVETIQNDSPTATGQLILTGNVEGIRCWCQLKLQNAINGGNALSTACGEGLLGIRSGVKIGHAYDCTLILLSSYQVVDTSL